MIFMLIYIFLTLFSQVILKKNAIKNKNIKTGGYIIKMLKSPSVIFAYSISFINLFVLIIVLFLLPLLSAYIYMSSLYILSILIDHFYFKQKLNFIKILGALFIIFGIILFRV